MSGRDVVIAFDPVGDFAPGEVRPREDILVWLEDGELALGMLMQIDGVEYRVCDGDDGLALESEAGQLCVEAALFGWRAAGLATPGAAPTWLRVLRALERMTEEAGGVPPTNLEIAQALGVSDRAVKYHIGTLMNDGYLERRVYLHRDARLTPVGYAALDRYGRE